MPAPFRFADSWLRISRARPYFRELRAEIDAYRSRQLYETTQDFDARTGEYVVRGVVREHPMPIVSLIAGDIAHCLRASLDYAMWELLAGTSAVPDKQIFFPVARTKQPGVTKLLAAVHAISPAAATEVERLQPYNPSRAPESQLLELLHEIDIEDKHHRLNIVACAIFKPGSFLSVPAGIGLRVTSDIFDQDETFIYPFEDGTEILRYRIPSNHEPVSVGTKLIADIAFGRGSFAEGKPLYKTLDSLLTFASQTLDKLTAPLP
jgi:hypothetical protein